MFRERIYKKKKKKEKKKRIKANLQFLERKGKTFTSNAGPSIECIDDREITAIGGLEGLASETEKREGRREVLAPQGVHVYVRYRDSAVQVAGRNVGHGAV